MLLHLVRRELLDHMLSLRFAIACVVCLLAFLLSFGLMTRDYSEAMSTYNMNRTMHKNEILQITEPWRLGQGRTVDRPLNVLNVLVKGISGELTESVQVREGNRLDFSQSEAQNAVAALFPEVDYVFIVGIIMSLLALAFAYDAVAGEHEAGILKVLMSYSVPRDRVILGKWIGGFLALVGPFAVAFLAGLLIASLMPDIAPGLEESLSIVGLFFLALLYVGAIYSLGLLVSCRTQTASTAITVLLLLWVVLILAIPNMGPHVTTQLMPIPSAESLEREKKELQADRQQQIQQMVKAEQERTGNERVWADTLFRQKMMGLWEEAQEEVRKLEEGYALKVEDQTRWSGIIARISPLTSFNLAAYDVEAAGIEQESQFIEALRNYGTTWQEYSEQKQEAWRKFMESARSADGHRRMTRSDMEQFKVDASDYPRFEFDHMPFADRLDLVWVDVLLLLLWNVVFFMVAYLSFLRYEIN